MTRRPDAAWTRTCGRVLSQAVAVALIATVPLLIMGIWWHPAWMVLGLAWFVLWAGATCFVYDARYDRAADETRRRA